jgi:hypothetical protein
VNWCSIADGTLREQMKKHISAGVWKIPMLVIPIDLLKKSEIYDGILTLSL